MFLHLLGSFLLSAVFLVAGALKLSDRAGTAKNLREFGVPERFSGPGALALPAAEIVLALALWPASTAIWGAAAALALLLLFIAAIGWNLLRGRQPACRCFGQVSARPVGVSTLVRNGLLAAIAGFLIANDAPTTGFADLFSSIEFLKTVATGLGIVVFATLAMGSWLVLNLMQQQGRLLLRLETLEHRLGGHDARPHEMRTPVAAVSGLPVGAKAPDFELPGLLEQAAMSMTDLLSHGHPTMLVFSDPSCGPCNELMPAIAAWQKELENRITVAFVNRGDRKANEEKAAALGLKNVLLQAGDEVATRFEVYGTPSAVLVGPDGLIQFPTASGLAPIERLFKQAGGDAGLTQLVALPPAARSIPARVGDVAPEFALQSIAGKSVRLSERAGKKLLLLFWNPGCGFCSQMLDRLRQWESDRSDQSSELILISTGTVQANRDLGLACEVLLDQSFSVGALYGAGGTPSAVLVDEDGKIGSALGVGPDAVLALANFGQSAL